MDEIGEETLLSEQTGESDPEHNMYRPKRDQANSVYASKADRNDYRWWKDDSLIHVPRNNQHKWLFLLDGYTPRKKIILSWETVAKKAPREESNFEENMFKSNYLSY
jgi:hypothetical protein